jgi:predicted GNAT family acetyltransferase
MSVPLPEVRHNAQAQRFEIDFGGDLARADYRRHGDVLRMVHTEVPRRLEGRGIAAALVKAAIAYARAEGLRIEPACSYVTSYMRRHPEAHDVLADGPRLR